MFYSACIAAQWVAKKCLALCYNIRVVSAKQFHEWNGWPLTEDYSWCLTFDGSEVIVHTNSVVCFNMVFISSINAFKKWTYIARVVKRWNVWSVVCSHIYKEHMEIVEHIERDLHKFREATKELTQRVDKVVLCCKIFFLLFLRWQWCKASLLVTLICPN